MTPPKATMFVWAQIPEAFRHLGSVDFSKLLLQEASVAVSPGIGFGEYGEGYVRFGLIENEHRTPPGHSRHKESIAAGRARCGDLHHDSAKPFRIGICGLGTVASGVINIFNRSQSLLNDRSAALLEICHIGARRDNTDCDTSTF